MANSLPKVARTDFIKILRESSKALYKLRKVDPRERYVILYPDSEHVYAGMGFKLLGVPPAEKVFEEASDFVKKDLLKLCLDGPKSDLLDSIENRHLVAFVTSHATVSKLAHERGDLIQYCKAAGGVGVGFVNGLVFSGALSFRDGLDLVQKQGLAMDRAAKLIPSAKVKIHIKPATRKSLVCRSATEHCLKKGIPPQSAICSVAKQSHPHVLFFAGHEEAIKYLEEDGSRLFEFRKISRVKTIPHAFHTDLMRPAQEYLRVYLEHKIKANPEYLKEPETCSVYSSTSGCRLRTVKSIKKDLVNYPVKPILVEQLLHCLFDRPKSLAQPNILVVWDKNLLQTLENVNRKARSCAKLLN